MSNILSNTKLQPCYNFYQYLIIGLVAVFIDIVLHFFSTRKYNALRASTSGSVGAENVFGFAPELGLYYKSLCRKGPLTIDTPGTFYANCNSYLVGALIAFASAVCLLLITDLILQAIDYRNSS